MRNKGRQWFTASFTERNLPEPTIRTASPYPKCNTNEQSVQAHNEAGLPVVLSQVGTSPYLSPENGQILTWWGRAARIVVRRPQLGISPAEVRHSQSFSLGIGSARGQWISPRCG